MPNLNQLSNELVLELYIKEESSQHVTLFAGETAKDSLLLKSNAALTVGAKAVLKVFLCRQSFDVAGTINSVQQKDEYYLASLTLDHTDNLSTRMLLQITEIEQYRDNCIQKGHDVSLEQAACEWIVKYAGDFADEFDRQ